MIAAYIYVSREVKRIHNAPIICLHGQLTTWEISPVDDRPNERLLSVNSF